MLQYFSSRSSNHECVERMADKLSRNLTKQDSRGRPSRDGKHHLARAFPCSPGMMDGGLPTTGRGRSGWSLCLCRGGVIQRGGYCVPYSKRRKGRYRTVQYVEWLCGVANSWQSKETQSLNIVVAANRRVDNGRVSEHENDARRGAEKRSASVFRCSVPKVSVEIKVSCRSPRGNPLVQVLGGRVSNILL